MRRNNVKTKELIDALRICADDDIICPACERYETMGNKGGTAECVEDLMLNAAEELERLEAELQERNHWIPVTERLPSEEEWLEARFSSFLCWGHKPVPGGVAVEEIRIIPYTCYNGWECEGLIITHWMPPAGATEGGCGMSMANGIGCKNCPVNPCHTLYYRGSYCAEQRAKYGLGDPQTNADRIRAMSDRELAAFLAGKFTDHETTKAVQKGEMLTATYISEMAHTWFKVWMRWLQQPVEELNDGN